jgi:catechol 2,3-dioxygenase-like lactoylglutathione lyase family enzyme
VPEEEYDMITRFEHMSFTVASLDRAVQFWTEGLGFKVASVSERTGDWQARVTGVPGAQLKVAHLFGYGHHMEFIEYLQAPGNSVALQPNMAGVAHVCLEVEDIEKTIKTLATLGAAPQGELIKVDSGPFKGCRAIYMRDPNGVIIELEEMPGEVNYDPS